jgi:hypothetical protein
VGEAGPETPAELAGMFNWGTTLTLATAVSYAVLFVGTALAAALLIDTSVLEQTLQRPAHATDYLTIAWIISCLATVGGAIGSGWKTRKRYGPRHTDTIPNPTAGRTRKIADHTG